MRANQQYRRPDPAEEILRERLASGQVTTDEYRRSLRILRGEMPDDLDMPKDE